MSLGDDLHEIPVRIAQQRIPVVVAGVVGRLKHRHPRGRQVRAGLSTSSVHTTRTIAGLPGGPRRRAPAGRLDRTEADHELVELEFDVLGMPSAGVRNRDRGEAADRGRRPVRSDIGATCGHRQTVPSGDGTWYCRGSSAMSSARDAHRPTFTFPLLTVIWEKDYVRAWDGAPRAGVRRRHSDSRKATEGGALNGPHVWTPLPASLAATGGKRGGDRLGGAQRQPGRLAPGGRAPRIQCRAPGSLLPGLRLRQPGLQRPQPDPAPDQDRRLHLRRGPRRHAQRPPGGQRLLHRPRRADRAVLLEQAGLLEQRQLRADPAPRPQGPAHGARAAEGHHALLRADADAVVRDGPLRPQLVPAAAVQAGQRLELTARQLPRRRQRLP